MLYLRYRTFVVVVVGITSRGHVWERQLVYTPCSVNTSVCVCSGMSTVRPFTEGRCVVNRDYCSRS